MVIDDLDQFGAAVPPHETEAPLMQPSLPICWRRPATGWKHSKATAKDSTASEETISHTSAVVPACFIECGVGSTRSAADLPRRGDRRHVGRLNDPERAERLAHRVGDVARRQVTVMLLDHAGVAMA
jgi:hypothetical protein